MDLLRPDPSLFRIEESQHCADNSGEFYLLRLDKKIHTSRTEDLQGQIIRSTGFQTDGFSLGAILYDMISGGKNPQAFYTYCIVSLTSLGQKSSYSIEDLLRILAPQQGQELDLHTNEKLNLSERRRVLLATLEARDLDSLLNTVIEIAFNKVKFKPSSHLGIREKWALILQTLNSSDLDDFVSMVLRSAMFTNATTQHGQPAAVNAAVNTLSEELRNYRFRHFHLVSDLLRDKRGVLIPRDILRIIVACMVRDVDGSYYRRDPKLGYASEVNFEAASRILQDVQELLGQPHYLLPESARFPQPLQVNLLFRLRSLSQT